MTSHKVNYSRRPQMLRVAAEAPAILASATDRLENSFWPSKTVFFHDYPAFSNDGRPWEDDDKNIDLMALVVVDEFPAETLNEVLRKNAEEAGESYLWLADTYDTLPDWDPTHPAEGTAGQVDDNWRSPFIGSAIQDIAAFIEAAPKPSKPLSKRFFAVLHRAQYEKDKQLLIYRILETESAERKLQTVPCPFEFAGLFFVGFDRSCWDQAVEEQAFYYGEGAYWSDDNASNQVMALFVLDEFPTETIDQILNQNLEESDEAYLWLADAYENLPDYRPNHSIVGTTTPVDSSWQSPFVGKSIADAANFVRNTPKPPKPLCKRFFAVLQKDYYEESGNVLICRISPGDAEDELEEGYREYGVENFKEAGRSLVCKVVSAKQVRREAGNGILPVTSAMADISVTTQDGRNAEYKGIEPSEFKVEMLGCPAAEMGLFFVGFNRYMWWEHGGGDAY